MPRMARRKSRTGIYHIILRGVNKQIIFECHEDKIRFLKTLARYKSICKFKIYGYCLMDNHVHLLLEESEEPISYVIKRISSSYVYWYNSKYDRCGHLFQGRFRSEYVEDYGYFLRALRYIHQNPLKAGLTDSVVKSNWTSMGEYIKKTTMVDIDFALSFFSEDRKKAVTLLTEYMKEPNSDQCLEDNEVYKMHDNDLRDYLHSLGVTSTSLQQMEKSSRNAIIAKLKELNGVSIRQISRITGISKSVIQRIGQ